MVISNQENIDAYSHYPLEAIDAFGDEGDFGRQQLLNPHLLRLLGDVAGKRVLDAGCGTGYLCRKLAILGAAVTGVEPTESFLAYCQRREVDEPLGIIYEQHDLSMYATTGVFDIVVSNQVFMDIWEYTSAIRNCVDALAPGGKFLVSLQHPCFENTAAEYEQHGFVQVAEYLNAYTIPQTYGIKFHRPLSTYVNLILRSGCRLDEMVEPQLSDTFSSLKDAHIPSYMILSFTKR